MTEKIDHIISSIQERTKKLKEQLATEQLSVRTLEAEVTRLKEERAQMDTALKNQKEENVQLHTELKKWQDKDHKSTPAKTHKEEDIEALVREIEYCIDQLKNNG